MKAIRIFAAVLVTAVSLIVVTIILFRSARDESLTSRVETAHTNNGTTLPTSTAEVRKPSLTTENPKQAPTVGKSEAVPVPKRPARVADVRQRSLVIESPKQGATVDMREDLTGRLESEGWPVIFVQADIPGQPWWCQAPVAKVDGGRFSTKVVFGDEFTPEGTRFRIAGIVTPTREEALKFDIGSKHLAPPEGYPKSVEVVVTHR
jgi:hypothetical protein